MAARCIVAGNDHRGFPSLYELMGDEAVPFANADSLEPQLGLDGVLGEDDLAPPPLEAVRWVDLPRYEPERGVLGLLEVRAPVIGAEGPIWRPRLAVRLRDVRGELVVEVADDLATGTVRGGVLRWRRAAQDSHAGTVTRFLSQPMETIRMLSVGNRERRRLSAA